MNCSRNSASLKRLNGGTFIKQGDSSSSFSFQLLDENGEPRNLNNHEAIVKLVTPYNVTIYETKKRVIEDVVTFTIDKPVRLGKCFVEIWVGGYIFPSSNDVEINIIESSIKYTNEQLFDNSHTSRIEELEEKIENLAFSGGVKPFLYYQTKPSEVWIINHNLGRYPDPVVIDSAGTMVHGVVQYNDINTLTITFNAPFSGHAELD